MKSGVIRVTQSTPPPLWNQLKARAQKLKENGGNVLFIILLCVFLFAALSYAVTNSTRSGGGDASREQDALKASQMIQYATSITTAVMRVKISNGCTDEQISFENLLNTSAINPNSPTDFRCHVFRAEGGNIIPIDFRPLDFWDTTGYWYTQRSVLFVESGFNIAGVGKSITSDSSSTDLVMFWSGIKKSICEQLNQKLHGTTSIPQPYSFYRNPFIGTFGSYSVNGLPSGQYAYCVRHGSTDPYYYFYQVLVAR